MSYRTIAAITLAACVIAAIANVIASSILREAAADDGPDFGVGSHRWPDDGGEAYEPEEDA